MTHYSKFHAIFASLYSADLYRDIRIRWDGLGITYLFLLHVMLITPAIILFILMLDRLLFTPQDGTTLARTMMMEAIAQMPTLHWEDNQLTLADDMQPRTITLTFENQAIPLARIEPDASVSDTGTQGEFMLLNRQGIHFIQQGGSVKSETWDAFNFGTQTMTQADMTEQADKALLWLDDNRSSLYFTFGLFLWAFTILFLFIYRFVKALLFACVGLLICSIKKTRIDYYTLVRLATVAITPALLIEIVLTLLIGSGISFIMSTVVTTGYMVFAIHANQSLEPQKA